MSASGEPLIAIVGRVEDSPDAAAAAEELGRELAKAGFRILVYSSDPRYPEAHVVKGYVASKVDRRRSIQVRYPLGSRDSAPPAFPEQQTHASLFDWRPDHSPDFAVSFYPSLKDVDGVLLLGGRYSTKIAGLVAMGYRGAILALAEDAMTVPPDASPTARRDDSHRGSH